MKITRSKIELVEDMSTAKILPQFAAQNTGESGFTGQDIEIALKRLSPELYIPFKMYTSGYKYYEIAEQTGVPIGTVKTRMHNGRIKLKKILKEYQYYA
ncbi:ECF RNA polymerase sigma factor SigR [compost metagenome]